MLHEIPRLFGDNGEFIAADTSQMDPAMLEIYSQVANAVMANQAADKFFEEKRAKVKAALSALADVENYIRAHFKPTSFLDEWRANKSH
jgi:hypothetical protein